MIEALKARIKRLYAIRNETDLEPFGIDQPVAPPPQPARCCNNCDSHGYSLLTPFFKARQEQLYQSKK